MGLLGQAHAARVTLVIGNSACANAPRVQLNAAGRVELKLKTPWRDGTTHLVMSSCSDWQRWSRGRGCT